MNWNALGDVAFYLATISSVLFAILYLLFAPWWKTPAGRNIMAVMGTMGVAFAYFSWAIAIGGAPPAFYPVRALLFIGIAASVTWRTVMFIKHHVFRSLRSQEKEIKHELEDAR